MDSEIQYYTRNEDQDAIDRHGFVAVTPELLPFDDRPEDRVCVVARLPLDEFLSYECQDINLQPLREAAHTFYNTEYAPTQTLHFTYAVHRVLYSHITACYVKKVMLDAEITMPLDFLVWYFQNAKQIQITGDTETSFGDEWRYYYKPRTYALT